MEADYASNQIFCEVKFDGICYRNLFVKQHPIRADLN